MKNLTRVAIAFIKNNRAHFLHERSGLLSKSKMTDTSVPIGAVPNRTIDVNLVPDILVGGFCKPDFLSQKQQPLL